MYVLKKELDVGSSDCTYIFYWSTNLDTWVRITDEQSIFCIRGSNLTLALTWELNFVIKYSNGFQIKN